jgi:hypothetical protein
MVGTIVAQKRAGEHVQNAARLQGECVPQPGTHAPSDGMAAAPARPTVALTLKHAPHPASCDESRERETACGDGA